MRQTGRWLPEYRALRSQHPVREILDSADLIVEATLMPLHRLPLDAAPVFTGPTLLLEALGLPPAAPAGRGGARPRETVVTTGPQILLERVRPAEVPGSPVLQPTLDALRRLGENLRGPSVLGMAAAPFTLAAYAIEGGSPRSFSATRAIMHGEPAAWHRLCERLATAVADWLVAQVEAGAHAVQMSDAWSQTLSAGEYHEFVLPHSRAVCQRVSRTGAPILHYGTGVDLLEGLAEAGGDVIGVDWRTPIDEAWARIGGDRGIQGNLAPTALVAPFERMLESAADVLDRVNGRPGHVFNLGHGLLATSPAEHVSALVRYVQMQTGE